MASTIQVTNVGAATNDGKYQVTWEVLTAVEMTNAIFVHTYASRKYSHVAAPADLTLPSVPTAGQAFYRSATAVAIFEDITAAAAARANVGAAIQSLVDEYNTGLVALTTPATQVYV